LVDISQDGALQLESVRVDVRGVCAVGVGSQALIRLLAHELGKTRQEVF